MNTDILFADNLDDMISGSFDRYCTHALCREGEASFLMTGEWFPMRILVLSGTSTPASAAMVWAD